MCNALSTCTDAVVTLAPQLPAFRTIACDLRICFDIETGARPESEIQQFLPPYVKPPPEFDESDVRYGNIKDPVKRMEKLSSARDDHRRKMVGWQLAKQIYEERQLEQASLSASTGHVLAIGYVQGDVKIIHGADSADQEPQLLRFFWSVFEQVQAAGGRLVGHCIKSFDLPFLMQRSMMLGVHFPRREILDRGRFWHSLFSDSNEAWHCGQPNTFISLIELCARLDIPDTKEPDGGRLFAQRWAEDRQAAVDYLVNDLSLTEQVAERLYL